ncbi:MAG: hypothetical protein OEZ01_11365 [Candidatus Heimdallarchaeota archaeon]|nr:hypothetical protein [Candidatus Heimdallarchaeota archaeon]MDH5646600.1 hypothetical protein [Candidatus Heimdallarchaeota archaeon]
MLELTPLIILIDTNVIYHAQEYKINIINKLDLLLNKKYKVVVHPCVESEIIDDLTAHNKNKLLAKFGIQYISNFESFNDPNQYNGTDIALLNTAKQVNGIVLTFDKILKQRCLKEGVAVITNTKSRNLQIFGYTE